MNRILKILALSLTCGSLCASCGGDDEPAGGGGPAPAPGPSGNYPSDVTLAEPLLSGEIKAGVSGAIEIYGSGFDAEMDYLMFGWEEDGQMKYGAPLGEDVKLIKSTRITVGVHVDQEVIGKTVKLYLDRVGYDPMPLTGELEIALPAVSEGYIPDPAFRARLQDMNVETSQTIAPMFNELGIIPPASAATVGAIDIASSAITSLEGLELFTGVTHLMAWDMTELRVADFTKWKPMKSSVFVQLDRGVKLEKILVGPTIMRIDCIDCNSLKEIDFSQARWFNNLQMYSTGAGSYLPLETADMRRLRQGIFVDKDQTETKRDCDTEGEYTVMRAGAQFQFPGTCHILVDYQQLVEKRGSDSENNKCNYNAIYDAWTRGATIDVYSSKDIEKHLGTVPMYSENPKAIAANLDTADEWVPAQTE